MARPIRTRAALWTATGVLTAGLAAGGVAQAVSRPSPNPTTGKPPATADAKHNGKHAKAHGIDRLGGQVLHGDLVVRTKDGNRTMALQRGTVVSVSGTSLQVRSTDGFTATYVVNGDTKIRKGKDAGPLATGEQVTVVATRSGSALTATRVAAHQPRTEKPQTSR